MRWTRWLFGLLFGAALLAVPLGASAENISISPTDFDFGEVEVGTSQTQIFTITSTESNDLVLQTIQIVDDSSGSFELSGVPSFPYLMAQGDTLDITVTFTPAFAAYLEGSFIVASNAVAPNNYIEVPVSGTGVESEPPPSVTVEDILAFFDQSVANGTLVGDGPGNSATGRRGALRNMIEASGDLIDQGEFEQACQQPWSAYDRCDGASPPPDFVSGEAASTLNDMIFDLLELLNCTGIGLHDSGSCTRVPLLACKQCSIELLGSSTPGTASAKQWHTGDFPVP